MDSSHFDAMQSLRNELATKYFKNQLDAYSLYIYGIVLSKLKLVDEAIIIFIESLKKRPTLWCSWLELSTLIKSLETLHSLNLSSLPQHWMKDLFLAHCYMELSLSEEAVSIYCQYCDNGFAKSVYIKSQMAKCYDNLREGKKAKFIFESIRKNDPFSLDFMDIYSNILFVLEEHAQLAILAQEVSEIDKYKPESCCIIGNYYSLQNEHHKAVNYFQRALKLNPSYLQAWTLMGHEFMELKNSTSAIQSYTNAVELNPKDYRAWYGLGQAYEILKLYSYSLYYYKQTHLLRPSDSRFIVALADVYVKLEKWDEAKRCYIKAYSVGDYEGASLCKLAKVYDKLNEPINVAIAYDQFTEDQKLHRRATTSQINELSQAYKYLANFYLKKMKLDNAHEAATKCLDFAETRQEAQSILNQIAQQRNLQSLEKEANDLNDSEAQSADGAATASSLKVQMDTATSTNFASAFASAAAPNNDESSSLNSKSEKVEIEIESKPKTSNSSDSESDTFFSDFNIKRFSNKNDHK
jgi:anaphase-promoting complex subunit 8